MPDNIEPCLKKMEDAVRELAKSISSLRAAFNPPGAARQAARKYELTDEKREVAGRTLRRIRALKDIPARSVRAGDLGGFVESEGNLSHDGTAWVFGEASVSDRARVFGEAWVSGEASVSDTARVFGETQVFSGDHNGGPSPKTPGL